MTSTDDVTHQACFACSFCVVRTSAWARHRSGSAVLLRAGDALYFSPPPPLTFRCVREGSNCTAPGSPALQRYGIDRTLAATAVFRPEDGGQRFEYPLW